MKTYKRHSMMMTTIVASLMTLAAPGPAVVWTATACAGQGGVAKAPVELEGQAVFAGLDGLVHSLDARTGVSRWQVAASRGAPCVGPSSDCGIQSTPLVLSGRVILYGTNNGDLVALDKRTNGTKLWTFSTQGAVMGAATLATEAGNNYLYIGSDDRHVYKLQLEAGRPTEKWAIGTSGAVNAAVLRVPPTIPGTSGHLVFTSFDGEVHAVREVDGQPIWTFNATAPNGTTVNTM